MFELCMHVEVMFIILNLDNIENNEKVGKLNDIYIFIYSIQFVESLQ